MKVDTFVLPNEIPSSENSKKVVLENQKSFQEFISGFVGNDFYTHIEDVAFELHGHRSSLNIERIRLLDSEYQKRFKTLPFSSYLKMIEMYPHLEIQENIRKIQGLIDAFVPQLPRVKHFKFQTRIEIEMIVSSFQCVSHHFLTLFTLFVFFSQSSSSSQSSRV